MKVKKKKFFDLKWERSSRKDLASAFSLVTGSHSLGRGNNVSSLITRSSANFLHDPEQLLFRKRFPKVVTAPCLKYRILIFLKHETFVIFLRKTIYISISVWTPAIETSVRLPHT